MTKKKCWSYEESFRWWNRSMTVTVGKVNRTADPLSIDWLVACYFFFVNCSKDGRLHPQLRRFNRYEAGQIAKHLNGKCGAVKHDSELACDFCMRDVDYFAFEDFMTLLANRKNATKNDAGMVGAVGNHGSHGESTRPGDRTSPVPD